MEPNFSHIKDTENIFHNTFQNNEKPVQSFTNPHDELHFLRQELAKKEAELQSHGVESTKEQLATQLIETYKQTPIEEVVAPESRVPTEKLEAIALQLRPETHDRKVEELVGILMQSGVRNALEAVRKMGNPHLDDDFHRFLVQYLAAYHSIPGLKNSSETYKNLNTTLFQVTLPPAEEQGGKSFKEAMTLMEQFYASMQVIGPAGNKEENYFSFEIGLSNESEEIIFYVTVGNKFATLFEKQVLGLFSDAHIKRITDDYNIFFPEGFAAGSYAVATNIDLMPLKIYDSFDKDPMNLLLGVFERIKKSGEGASVQVIVKPVGDRYIKEYGKVLDRLRKGETMKKIKESLSGEFVTELKSWGKAVWNVFADDTTVKKNEEKEKNNESRIDDIAVQNVTKKLSSTIVETTIRIVTSAENQFRADELLRDLESAFLQYTEVQSNGIQFKRIKPNDLPKFLRDYTYRRFDSDRKFRLNFQELATMFHFPSHTEGSAQLKQARAATHPAPMTMGTEGILLGHNVHRGTVTPIHFKPIDRLRHYYTIGQTGTGKTVHFLKMIIQDIKNGDGCCFIDPHGSDINTILANVPPERLDDVIFFDPAYTERPIGLNMLEFDERSPQQKSLVIGELMSLFDKLFDMKAQGGAMFGQYFRNAALLNMEDPASGNTVLEITRVLANEDFRKMKLSKNKNPIIAEFWKSAEATSGEQGLENFVPYISSKFDDFISNEFLRPIILQEKSAFNFREIIDTKKILIVNLSKGLLGEKNANLLGLIIIMKLQMAAMSRADSLDLDKFPPFYVYLDEFQSVVTESISAILSEARKYKLSLNMTHQYMQQ